MRQVLFTLPILGVRVFGFGAMIVLAFISATWLGSWRAKREKLDPEVILDMAFWVVFSGMIGARLFYSYEYWGKEIKSLWDILQYWKGGIVFYGGILGGSIAFLVYRHYRPFPLRPYMDVIAPSIAIGIFFGRIGCFLNGCCYGDPCQLPWAVSFPRYSPPWAHQVALGLISHDALWSPDLLGAIAGSSLALGVSPHDALWSLPIHPTQIYAAIDGLVLLLLLSAYYPLRKRDGEVMALLMVTYPVTRFLVEFLRNDEVAFFAGMTISQTISLVLFAAGLVYWAWLLTQPKVLYRDQHREPAPRHARLAAARP
jgi:phosphatidylglycerol:prolipoprotein diacylglycerol transferase